MDKVIKFSFRSITTKMDKGAEKKVLNGMPTWKQFTKSAVVDGDKAFAVRTGHLSGITGFDFDTVEAYEELVSSHPELKECKTIRTKKGFHIYFMYDPTVLTTTNFFPSVDIRNDDAILICPPTQYKLKDGTIAEYIDLGGELKPVPDYLKQTAIVKKEVKAKSVKAPVEVAREKDEVYTFIRNLIKEGLLSHLSTDYQSWMKVGLALKTIGALDLFLLFSKTSKAFDEKGCIETWNGLKPSQITIASLYFWAKQRDKMAYYALMERKMSMSNEYEVSLIANRIVDNVVRIGDDFFVYESYWKKVSKDDLRCVVMKELRSYVMSCLTVLTKQVDMENYEEIVTRLRSVLNGQINKTTAQKNIIDQYTINLVQSEVEMDTLQPYYFCFKNCAFDLRTNKRVETTREDFITQNTGYDYEEPTKEQVDEIAKLVESILPDPEKRRFYMSVLRTGMIGLAFENLIFATGEGGNGKGLLNDFFAEMMGRDYYYKGDKKTLTEPMKTGANPEVANIHNKRTVLFSEPEQGSKIQVGTMKELTGGGTLCARGLYQSNCVVNLTLTALLEYNTKSKPTLNGDVDDAIQRRLKVCRFDQSFKLKPVDGEQQANLFYKTNEFKTGFRCALFKYLLSYDDIVLYDTEVIQKETMDYFFGSDDFLGWFDSHYELTDDESDFVSLKDMLDCYKHETRGKKEKRAMNRKLFLETFESNIKFKKLNLYCERKKIDGVDHRSIFLRIRKLEE
jgi:phage/plasmid-associated DNA primase